MPATSSELGSLLSLGEAQRTAVLDSLSEGEAERLLHDWPLWARPNQMPPPGDWRVWLLQAGRGFGKTRTGAEWVRAGVESGCCRRVALVAPTAADARDVMIEGESGILAVCPPWDRPLYEPSKRRITWPNGAIATAYSADEPDRLRGPQHDRAWADELAAWNYPEAFDMLLLGLRLGDDPRVVVTTTPRPIPILRALLASPTTAVTRGTTYDNMANLAPAFREAIIRRYEGTRLGRQELEGILLDDHPGALWKRDRIEELRVCAHPPLARVVVAVDPQAADPATVLSEETAETGIVVAGVTAGSDPHAYVLDDRSLKATPHGWASEAVAAFHRHRADRVVAEVNNGGAMVEFTIQAVARERNYRVPYRALHASRGKQIRAEPVAALYERGRVHHVGVFPELEDQLCGWEPGMKSPDRLDALVWALTDLIVEIQRVPAAPVAGGARPLGDFTPR